MTSGKTKPIIFFGTEEFSATSLSALIEPGFNVVAVVTKPDSQKGRGQKTTPPTVKKIANAHGIPVWQPQKLAEIVDKITSLQPVAGVLVSFGKIIPQSIIDLFTPGIINLHPSKLPLYRGPSPIESAILNGDTETGVSIMKLSAEMDTGPVYTFTPHPLTGTETQPELYDDLSKVGAQALVDSLEEILDGSLTATDQDDDKATYCQMIKKSDGVIDRSKPAAQIERQVRAFKGWPGSRATLGNIDVKITSCHISPTPTELSIECADGKHLAIDTLIPAGKKEMPARAFLAGYKNRL